MAAAIEAHRVDPALHRVLAEQIPRVGALADVELFNREALELFRAYLEDRREELEGLDLDLAAFVCVTSIEALTHTAVLHRSDLLSDAAAARLVDEASRLVVGYLTGPSGSGCAGRELKDGIVRPTAAIDAGAKELARPEG